MKKFKVLVCIAVLCLVPVMHAGAAEFEFHGDMNNRAGYSNHFDFLRSDQEGAIDPDSSVSDFTASIKYRFWFDASTDDDDLKGVFAIEIGALEFGEEVDFSGDEDAVEVRWGYIDFQLPGVDNKARTRIGLQPFTVNPFIWQETAPGVALDMSFDAVDVQAAWMRGAGDRAFSEGSEDISDLDSFFARVNAELAEGLKGGLFVLYQHQDTDGALGTIDPRDYHIKFLSEGEDLSVFTVGVDGSFNTGPFFFNWDLMYQTGELENISFDNTFLGIADPADQDYDLSAFFLHFDAGVKLNKVKLTYTFWYASGDDDSTDDDLDAFIATDVDVPGSLALLGSGTSFDDDNYFTERASVLDKGMIMNRVACDYQRSDKLTLGAALIYMLTAEDIDYTQGASTFSENDLGFEIDSYVKYKLFKNLEVGAQAGYLWAGDALDVYEGSRGNSAGDAFVADRDGSADEGIFVGTLRARFKF